MSVTVGIVGTGRMSTAFARRLIDTDHRVLVWNRRSENVAAAFDAGAAQVGSVAGLNVCDVIIVSLTNAVAVIGVVDELISAGMNGKLIIEMSTLLPADTQALGGWVVAAGAEYIECPVGGTVGPALKVSEEYVIDRLRVII